MASALSVSTLRPPELKSPKGEAVVKFLTDYEHYERQIKATNAGISGEKRVRKVGQKSCIAAELLVSLTELGTFPGAPKIEDVTDETVKEWLKKRSRFSTDDVPAKVRDALNRVKFVPDFSDPEGAALSFFAEVSTELRHNRVQHVQEESPKVLIEHLARKLEPPLLRSTINNRMKFWSDERKKDYKYFRAEVTKVSSEISKYAPKLERPPEERKSESRLTEEDVSRKKRQERFQQKREIGPANQQRQSGKKARYENLSSGWKLPCLNPDCKEKHPIIKCEKTSDELRKKLVTDYRKAKEEGKKANKIKSLRQRDGEYDVTLPGAVVSPAIGDYGADHSSLPKKLLQRMDNAGAKVDFKPFDPPVRLRAALKLPESVSFTACGKVRLDIRISLPCGILSLRNVDFWVIAQDMDEILLGRPLLKRLGLDLDKVLRECCEKGEEIDATMSTVNNTEISNPKLANLGRYQGIRFDEEEADPVDPVDGAAANMGFDSQEEINIASINTLGEASKAGMSEDGIKRARKMLEIYRDVFRIKLGNDPPASVEPYEVTLRDGSNPFRSTARRYAPMQRDFINSTVRCLEEIGAIKRNTGAKWASPALAVPKPGTDKLRFTVDLRGVNRKTVPVVSSMPDLEAMYRSLSGSKCFAKIDMCHAYWQIPLSKNSQEIMSIQTPLGVFSPTRILQGSTDAGNHFQSVTSCAFSEISDNVIQWLDDFLLHSENEEGLLLIMERFLDICARFGFKVHAQKIEIFKKSVNFCGRIVDEYGIEYDPRNLSALINMHRPETADNLQQFICASNWMRGSMPNYCAEVSPLRELLEQCYKKAGKRTKHAIRKISLSGLWRKVHEDSLERVKTLIARSVKLAHRKEGSVICLFADASDYFWASIITQLPEGQLSFHLENQQHEPMAFLSGKFTGHSYHWSTVEKEAFAIVESMTKLDHITASGEVHVYTDHANLTYIFNPFGCNPGVGKQVAHKLMRWALKLASYRYVIEFVSGEKNVWADMLTRWAAHPTTKVREAKLALLHAPLRLKREEEDWPARNQIISSQSRASNRPHNLHKDGGVYRDVAKRIWIPSEDEELKLRMMISAHCGSECHRSRASTRMVLGEHCFWDHSDRDVKSFCDSCVHCLVSHSGERVPRPLGTAMHAEKPNELIHFDFCYMAKSGTGHTYVLIIKDDLSSYCWMYPCENADAETVTDALLDWFTAFGTCWKWVSDQGTHFKNEVMKSLKEKVHAAHHFTLPYCPWSNGTVEVVCRELLRATKAILSELELPLRCWPSVIPLVQASLNNRVQKRLGNKAPITVFTGLPHQTKLGVIKASIDEDVFLKEVGDIANHQKQQIDALARAMDGIHKEAAAGAKKERERKRSAQNVKTGVRSCNFSEGDFVMRGLVRRRVRSKLSVKWIGPMRVKRCLSDFLFELEDLCTGALSTVHGSRIKFFRNRDFKVTEDIKDYLAFQQGEYAVLETFLGIRESAGQVELQAAYKGFEDEEPSWMSLSEMMEDVPEMVRDYLISVSQSHDGIQKSIANRILQNITTTE